MQSDYIKTVGWNDARPWKIFFERFSVPNGGLEEIEKRVSTNLQFYYTNYFIIGVVLSLYFFITHPALLIVSLLIAIMLLYFYGVKTTNIFMNNRPISDEQQMVVLGIASIILLFIFRQFVRFFVVILLVLCVILLHAILRPASKEAKFKNKLSDLKYHVKKATEDEIEEGISEERLNQNYQRRENITRRFPNLGQN